MILFDKFLINFEQNINMMENEEKYRNFNYCNT